MFLLYRVFCAGFPRILESPWKYLNFSPKFKALKVLENRTGALKVLWISFHRSLKVLEFTTRSNCTIANFIKNWSFRRHYMVPLKCKKTVKWPGLCPGPRWISLQCSPRPSSWWGGGCLLRAQEPHPRSWPFGLQLLFILERSLKSAYWLAYVIVVVMFLVYMAFQSARCVA